MRYAVIDQTVLGGTPANVLAIVESENAVPSVEAGQSLVCDPPAGVAAGWVFAQGAFAAPLTLPDLQAAKRLAVDARRDAILIGGYSHDFGGTVGVKVLQTRNLDDDTNWLTLQNSCLAVIMAGQGATVGAVIRTADNVNVPLSYSECLQVLLAMAAWGAAVYARSWTLKDAIAAAADQAALAAIDITTGWPATP